jgi:hypothetical protein
MQAVPAAAVDGASQGSAIATKMLKKANEVQAQDLQLIANLPEQPKANMPGMGSGIDVQG